MPTITPFGLTRKFRVGWHGQILVYQPTIDEFLTAPEPPLRGDGSVSIALPNHFLGAAAHVWIFFADRKNVKVSKSSYLGELAL